MAFAGNVRGDFNAVGEAHTSDLAKRRVRLLGSHRADYRAHTAFLRCAARLAETALFIGIQGVLQRGGFALHLFGLATFADHLIDSRHLASKCIAFVTKLIWVFAENEAIKYLPDGLIQLVAYIDGMLAAFRWATEREYNMR